MVNNTSTTLLQVRSSIVGGDASASEDTGADWRAMATKRGGARPGRYPQREAWYDEGQRTA